MTKIDPVLFPSGLETGDMLRVTRKAGAALELDEMLARVLGVQQLATPSFPRAGTYVTVLLEDGRRSILGPDFYSMRRVSPRDVTGLSTGRWRVARKVHVWRGARPHVWAWRAAPIPARGVAEDVALQELGYRDFAPNHLARAVEYAHSQVRRNLR